MKYEITNPPDEVTEELILGILDDFNQHLEIRLQAIERDFRQSIEQTREYLNRRVRARCEELIASGQQLDLRRKKTRPVIPEWRVPGGLYPPDDSRRQQDGEQAPGEQQSGL